MPLPSLRSERLRIVVGGLAVTFPFGGMFWHYLQFVLGLHQLGHDVMYLEDTGRWSYSPLKRTYVETGVDNANVFARNIERLASPLRERWMFRDAAGVTHGQSWERVQEFCNSADLFLNVSLSHDVHKIYANAQRNVLVDTDPLYTQALLADGNASMPEDEREHVLAILKAHDTFFTVGLNVGQDDCLVPTGGITWHPMVQPIVLSAFEDGRVAVADRERKFTTVTSWEPAEALTSVGNSLYEGKSREFERLVTLPGRCSVPLELALSGKVGPVEMLERMGWRVIDATDVSLDPWKYRRYLARSLGEFTAAKHAYVASRSGWFSDRSACYLALGVPVITQDTGFQTVLPTGTGLLCFRELDDAAAAIEDVASSPEKHAEAAFELAKTRFSAEIVLRKLLDTIS